MKKKFGNSGKKKAYRFNPSYIKDKLHTVPGTLPRKDFYITSAILN
jgi:hypothetical protein